jgi:hypothetical protein
MPRPRIEHLIYDNESYKYCKTCDWWLPLESFHYCCKTWDILDCRCAFCHSSIYKKQSNTKKIEKRQKYKQKILSWIKQNIKSIIEYSKNKDQLTHWVSVEKLKYILNHKKIQNLNNKNRRKTDINFRLKDSLRNRVRQAIKNNSKSTNTRNLIGCSIDYIKGYLECQFSDGMTWENYGKWHIDHIVPCDYFNFSIPENQFRCFNYKNLQPMWGKENLSKSNKITNKATKLIPYLQSIGNLKLDIKPNEKNESERRTKIAAKIKNFNQTDLGKHVKKEAHKKRSETMKKERDITRETINTKTCKKCCLTKPLSDYHKKEDSHDGLQVYCQICVKNIKIKWRKNNTQTNVKFKCTLCTKVYNLKDSLTRHIKGKHT